MHVEVNGVSLFVDIEGPKLIPDGPAMRERPTLLLLHGGPGLDHSMFRPDFSPLADIAQLVYVDHRGNGRSQAGPRESWTLAQWGDDVHALCEVLGIHRPVVLGASFGSFVALAYATRHPQHPAGLILESPAARWPADLAGALAEQARLAAAIEAGSWHSPVPAVVERPDLSAASAAARRADPDAGERCVQREAVAAHFWNGEATSFDFTAALAHLRCPTLILAGDADQTLPLPLALELAAAIPPAHARLAVFHGCDHVVHEDAPARTVQVVRDFLAA